MRSEERVRLEIETEVMEDELNKLAKRTDRGYSKIWSFPNGYSMSIFEVGGYYKGLSFKRAPQEGLGIFKVVLLKNGKLISLIHNFRLLNLTSFGYLFPYEVIKCAKKIAEKTGDSA